MPATTICFYRDEDGRVPVLEWIRSLPQPARRKCIVRVGRLAEVGYELRRPAAAYLGQELYELRARAGHVNLRLLYFFQNRNEAVLVHALTKEDRIPDSDFARAVWRRERFLRDPETHSHEEEI